MIELASPYTVAVVVYVVCFVGLLAWLRRVSTGGRRLLLAATLLLGLSAVTNAIIAAGLGTVVVNGSEVTLPSFLNNLVAYPVLWGLAAALAACSRRTLAVVTAIPFAQVLAYQVAAVTTGAVALTATAVVIGGHIVMVALFVNRIWPETSHLPDDRRLLHWKARNLLLFLIGMLIVYAFVALAGTFSAYASNVLSVYMEMLIRIGFAGFLFVNASAIGTDEPATQRTADSPTTS